MPSQKVSKAELHNAKAPRSSKEENINTLNNNEVLVTSGQVTEELQPGGYQLASSL